MKEEIIEQIGNKSTEQERNNISYAVASILNEKCNTNFAPNDYMRNFVDDLDGGLKSGIFKQIGEDLHINSTRCRHIFDRCQEKILHPRKMTKQEKITLKDRVTKLASSHSIGDVQMSVADQYEFVRDADQKLAYNLIKTAYDQAKQAHREQKHEFKFKSAQQQAPQVRVDPQFKYGYIKQNVQNYEPTLVLLPLTISKEKIIQSYIESVGQVEYSHELWHYDEQLQNEKTADKTPTAFSNLKFIILPNPVISFDRDVWDAVCMDCDIE